MIRTDSENLEEIATQIEETATQIEEIVTQLKNLYNPKKPKKSNIPIPPIETPALERY